MKADIAILTGHVAHILATACGLNRAGHARHQQSAKHLFHLRILLPGLLLHWQCFTHIACAAEFQFGMTAKIVHIHHAELANAAVGHAEIAR